MTLTRADAAISWIQPFPDTGDRAGSEDPAEIVVSRATLRLALIASWQYLPARQRAVLILRDVLSFSARDVADMLDMSIPAVKSALQRARGRLDDLTPRADQVVEAESPESRLLLDR